MKISLNWIGDFVDISDISADEVSSLLSMHTAEVEGIEYSGANIAGVIVAEVLTCVQHPDADKLSVTTLNYGGDETVQVVCGASNVRAGLKIALAPVGCVLPGDFKIKKAKLRGQLSQGMICSDTEIELGDDSSGIKELPSDAPVGARLIDYLKLSDAVLEVDNKSLTHRPDLWGHYGFARELATILKRPLKDYPQSFTWPTQASDFSVELDDSQITTCYQLAELSLTNGPQPSPAWMRQRLLAVGQRLVNDIVDVSNYVMLELGQPTHAFDKSKVKGSTLLVRAADDKEKFVALDESTCELLTSDFVIADAEKAVGLAGVMGGLNSEVDADTTSILLESACFDATTVRRSALHHNLRSEASTRFEKSLDPNYVASASQRVCQLLTEMRDDIQVLKAPVFAGNAHVQTDVLELDSSHLRVLLGIDIDNTDIVDSLTRLGFEIAASGDSIKAVAPSYRATKDIKSSIDLVEEVGRIAGYDKIVPQPLSAPIEVPQQLPYRQLANKLLLRMVNVHAAHETQSYSFIADEWAKLQGLDCSDFIQISNPVHDAVSLLRQNPALSLLQQVSVNEREFAAGRLCEFTKGYQKNPQGGEALESKQLALLCWGPNDAPKAGQESLVGQLRSIASDLCDVLNINVQFESNPAALPKRFGFAHPKQSLELSFARQSLGVITRIHPTIVDHLGVNSSDVALLLLDVDALIEATTKCKFKFQAPPKFPAVKVDVALAVPKSVNYAAVGQAVATAAGKLLDSIELFDVYSGAGLEDDQHSMAFSVLLRAADRTLSDKEEQKFISKVSKAAEQLGGNLRS
ncbi:MAG: phenylalanyl-tRNA synthetase beta chain [Myxococcota bacterium]|jgi:phenylalanyl-tRNA synthetase beta chain